MESGGSVLFLVVTYFSGSRADRADPSEYGESVFEDRRLDSKTVATVKRLVASCETEVPHDEWPYVYGLRGAPLAASFVGVGLDLLTSLIRDPPAEGRDAKRATKRLLAAFDPEVGIQASAFLAHALAAFELKWTEYSAKPPLSAGPPGSNDAFFELKRQLPAGLSQHYPIAEEDQELIDRSLDAFRYFDAEQGEIEEQDLDYDASSYMNYLARDRKYMFYLAREDQRELSPEQFREFVESHAIYVHRSFQMPVSGRALALVLGPPFAQSGLAWLDPFAESRMRLGISWKIAMDEFARMLGRVVARESMG